MLSRAILAMDDVMDCKYETGIPPSGRMWNPGDSNSAIRKINDPHLCNDDIVNLKDLINIVSNITNKQAKVSYNTDGGPFQNKKCIFSNKQIKDELKIQFKSLKQGIIDYYEWYKVSQS